MKKILFTFLLFTLGINQTGGSMQAKIETTKGEILIVTDPPFGGKCELIGRTLKCIQKDVINLSGDHDQIHTMWIFPYYMERFIQQEIPSIKMSDYQVCYSSNGTSSYKDGLEIGKQGARKV